MVGIIFAICCIQTILKSVLIKMKNTYYNDFKIKTEISTIILKNDWSNRVKTACKINHLKEKDICYIHYNCTANETLIQYRIVEVN